MAQAPFVLASCHGTYELLAAFINIVLLYAVWASAEPPVHARLTICSYCRGDLLHALTLLDEEDDINKVLKYFSYEHFYVIYCKVSH